MTWMLVALFAGAAHAEDDPTKVLEYRHAVMSSLGNHMKASSMVVKGEVARSDDLVSHATALYESSRFLTQLFPKGSGPEALGDKTEAKAEIWSDWDGFVAKNKVFQDESQKLLEVAKSGDLDAFKAQFGNVGKSCGGCHDDYRVEED
jgi:cytochrome c556